MAAKPLVMQRSMPMHVQAQSVLVQAQLPDGHCKMNECRRQPRQTCSGLTIYTRAHGEPESCPRAGGSEEHHPPAAPRHEARMADDNPDAQHSPGADGGAGLGAPR